MNFRKVIVPILGLLAVVGIVVSLFWGRTGLAGPKVSYPYICKDCKAVFDVSELKKDYPNNWRIPRGAGSDSVVICLRCNKGWAYPVTTCETCGTEHILHMIRDGRCPKCFPEVNQLAKKAGVDILFKRP